MCEKLDDKRIQAVESTTITVGLNFSILMLTLRETHFHRYFSVWSDVSKILLVYLNSSGSLFKVSITFMISSLFGFPSNLYKTLS